MLTCLLFLLALQVAPDGEGPEVSAIEPTAVPAYSPVVVELVGHWFLPSCTAMIDKGPRYVPVRTEYVDSTRLRAVLAAGLGPEPGQRRLVVRCGGERSRAMQLEVSPASQPGGAAEQPGAIGPPPSSEEMSGEPGSPVLVERLDPATVPAGDPFALTVVGSGFVDGATVGVLANVNAGTSRAPRYETVQFEAELASDSVLIVDFDRGFAVPPSVRSVVVKNPDGAESSPLYLTITRRSP